MSRTSPCPLVPLSPCPLVPFVFKGRISKVRLSPSCLKVESLRCVVCKVDLAYLSLFTPFVEQNTKSLYCPLCRTKYKVEESTKSVYCPLCFAKSVYCPLCFTKSPLCVFLCTYSYIVFGTCYIFPFAPKSASLKVPFLSLLKGRVVPLLLIFSKLKSTSLKVPFLSFLSRRVPVSFIRILI